MKKEHLHVLMWKGVNITPQKAAFKCRGKEFLQIDNYVSLIHILDIHF